MEWWPVVLVVALALAFTYTNGFHDAANAVATSISTRALTPLDGETDASRARLSATLAVWLAEMGAVSPTAAVLSVHPQTVRYRIARLRELFGPALDDPEARFELQLALRTPIGAD